MCTKLLLQLRFMMRNSSQNFGQVGNAFVRLANEETNEEVLRFDLGKISPLKQRLSFVNYTVIMDSGSLMQ